MSENREYVSSADEFGSVNISEDVVMVIAASAAAEVEGVYSLYPSYGREPGEKFSRKSLARSVRVEIEDRSVRAGIFIICKLGCPVNEVGAQVQQAVAEAIESATGLSVDAVNVHIIGVSLKKAK
jgi:uncharacterized alkaline shock family protein YloU